MNSSGFTLIEVLMVALIVAVLSSLALPQYTRSVERARATEAMAMVKQLDDAVYAYAADHQGDTTNACPARFSQLAITLPVTSDAVGSVALKNFTYTLGGATQVTIPGTSCKATLAERREGRDYDYYLWRHYSDTAKTSLSWTSKESKQRSIDVCKSLGIYTTDTPK